VAIGNAVPLSPILRIGGPHTQWRSPVCAGGARTPAQRSVLPARQPDPVAGRRRYGLLLSTTLLSLAVQGVASASATQQLVVVLLNGASLLLALRAAGLGERFRVAAAVLTAVIVVLTIIRVTAGGIGDGTARTMNAVLVACGPPAVAVGVVREVRSSGRVRVEAVMGVLALYVLVGMLFAFTYGAIDRFGDSAFFAGGAAATVSTCLYFSFTTLTTVGYGDFTAATDLGHTLAVFEALLGQIYLVTVVSVIVSNIRPRRGGVAADDAVR
jgi:hypothetical protein